MLPIRRKKCPTISHTQHRTLPIPTPFWPKRENGDVRKKRRPTRKHKKSKYQVIRQVTTSIPKHLSLHRSYNTSITAQVWLGVRFVCFIKKVCFTFKTSDITNFLITHSLLHLHMYHSFNKHLIFCQWKSPSCFGVWKWPSTGYFI